MSQNELENWIQIINTVCAHSFTKQTRKELVLKEINKECQLLEKNIEIENKMKKMAELQLNITLDPKSKEAVSKQILQWERNLEKLNVNLYRYKCYMASINSSEAPNPKVFIQSFFIIHYIYLIFIFRRYSCMHQNIQKHS